MNMLIMVVVLLVCFTVLDLKMSVAFSAADVIVPSLIDSVP